MANVEKFKYWCNKILPLVYDDSLSYYEFLGKVYEKLNETIDAVNANTEAVAAYDQRINDFIESETDARESWEDAEALKWAAFQAMFINAYDPDNAYVQDDLCSYQQKMYVANAATTGPFDPSKWTEIVLSDYLADYVADAKAEMQDQYNDFLEDYQRQFGIAQSVGSSTTDAISQIGIAKMLENIETKDNLINWTSVLNEKGIASGSGAVIDFTGGVATDYITISGLNRVVFKNCYTVAWYDTNKDYISGKINPTTETPPANAVYARCTIRNKDIGNAYVYDRAKADTGLSQNVPILSELAFRKSITLEQAGFNTIGDINRDGIYTFASATAPSDLPTELQGKPGTVISANIGTTRMFLVYGYSVSNCRVYIRFGTDATWQEPSTAMVAISNVTGADFDNYTDPNRSYYFSADDISGYANKPFDSSGVLMVQRQRKSGDRVMQIAYSNVFASGKKTIAIRSRLYGGTWTEWYIIDTPASQYKGKVINWIGDSIVDGNNFDEIVADYFEMTLNDYGVSGATIAKKTGGTRACISETYSDMTDTCDIVAVSCGTNDFQYDWTDFGTINDSTNDTFYGALNVLCLGLITKYPDKVIFFTTPIKRAQSPYTTIDSQNTKGKTLADYAEAIKEVCARYSIPVLDMYAESMLNPSIPAQAIYFDNVGTHPNATGRQIMARRVIGWLRQLC